MVVSEFRIYCPVAGEEALRPVDVRAENIEDARAEAALFLTKTGWEYRYPDWHRVDPDA